MKNPKKSTSSGDLRVGPFVLTKGRGERWSLKGVKGVRFAVESCEPYGFRAELGATSSPAWSAGGHRTPESAGREVLRLAVKYAKESLAGARREVAFFSAEVERDERALEILKTGQAPSAKPKAKKR